MEEKTSFHDTSSDLLTYERGVYTSHYKDRFRYVLLRPVYTRINSFIANYNTIPYVMI